MFLFLNEIVFFFFLSIWFFVIILFVFLLESFNELIKFFGFDFGCGLGVNCMFCWLGVGVIFWVMRIVGLVIVYILLFFLIVVFWLREFESLVVADCFGEFVFCFGIGILRELSVFVCLLDLVRGTGFFFFSFGLLKLDNEFICGIWVEIGDGIL